MPTLDRSAGLTLDEARARIAEACFPPHATGENARADLARDPARDPARRTVGHRKGAPEAGVRPEPETEFPAETVGYVGLEPELFPIAVRADGLPGARVPLRGRGGRPGVLEILSEIARTDPDLRPGDLRPGVAPTFDLGPGGQLTFEPGGQIEHSTSPHPTGGEALSDTRDVFCKLQGAFARHGIALVSTGIDLWHGAERVPQQLDAPRYHAMAAYFEQRGPHGRTMMRLTASQQVNLDLGLGATREERWAVALLASPLATASFATSPRQGWVNARAAAWQRLDPTRTGYPAGFLTGSGDAARQYVDSALAADVMLVRRDAQTVDTGRPGWTFADWMRDGHPAGWPTADDLKYHLSTLFFEVRPRGFFEIRTTDALPAPWLAAPVVLWTSLLYEPRARGEALDLLEPTRSRLLELWHRAARHGLADDELAALSERTWDVALEGARRLPAGYFTGACIETTENFLAAYTRRRRSPSDELRRILFDDPRRALEWAIGDADCPSPAQGPLTV